MKKTPLHEKHVDLNAKMVDFAGWDMPISYPTGINEEHLAVRKKVGMFDVSHMGEIRILGEKATEFLRYATINDVAKLKDGRGHYSMLPHNKGGLIDDLYIYRFAEENYLVICNASNIEVVYKHLLELSKDYEGVKVTDESEDWGLVALQGPEAEATLNPLVTTDLDKLKKNRVVETTFATGSLSCFVARTGYTGEDGFEILCTAATVTELWQTLADAEVVPCGLGARDTLRLEAGFPLFGHEFTENTNPLGSSYTWVVKDKPFYGRDAIWTAGDEKDEAIAKLETKLVAIMLEGKGVPRADCEIICCDEVVGTLTSGTLSPFSKKGIGMGWVKSSCAKEGQELQVRIRNKEVAAKVVSTPFY